MVAVELEWAEPPAEAFHNNPKDVIMFLLKQSPNKWARIKKGMKTTAGLNEWKKRGCETLAHRTNPGETPAAYDYYVRWKTPVAAAPFIHGGNAPAGARAPEPAPARKLGHAEAISAARAARGVPPEGLHPGTLRRVQDRPQA